MLWAVAGRFGLDCFDCKYSRLRFWYKGHTVMLAEENAAMEAAKNGK